MRKQNQSPTVIFKYSRYLMKKRNETKEALRPRINCELFFFLNKLSDIANCKNHRMLSQNWLVFVWLINCFLFGLVIEHANALF